MSDGINKTILNMKRNDQSVLEIINIAKGKFLGSYLSKQRVVKAISFPKENIKNRVIILTSYQIKELELKNQSNYFQEKNCLFEIKKHEEEFFMDMSIFVHDKCQLLLVLEYKNSLRVFFEDRLIKKINLDFEVRNYSILDIGHADHSYNQMIFGFKMLQEREKKLFGDHLQISEEAIEKNKGGGDNTSQVVKLICVKDSFVLITHDMKICFCELDKFEKKSDAIYNPLSIRYSSNYQIISPHSENKLYSFSINEKLSMLTFTLLVPAQNYLNEVEEQVIIDSSPKDKFTITDKIFKKKNKKQSRLLQPMKFKYRSYMLNILQLDTEEVPLKPIQPIESIINAPYDISLARSKNMAAYTDSAHQIKVFSVDKSNEYKTAVVYRSK